MKRREIKIPIHNHYKGYFNNWIIKNFDIKKHYNKRYISSIYYDDNNLTNAKDNIQGIPNRKKIRFRWYDHNYDNVTLEIKKRNNNTIFKDSYELKKKYNFKNKNYNFFNKKNNIDFHNNELKKYFYLNYQPIIKISYLRHYFIYKNSVRITFDENIHYDTINNNLSNKMFDSNNIIEFKFDPDFHILALELIKNSKFYPKRNSKYLKGLFLNKLIDFY